MLRTQTDIHHFVAARKQTHDDDDGVTKEERVDELLRIAELDQILIESGNIFDN